MVSGKHKSRTYRRVFKKTPGARVVLHHVARKPGKAVCATCGDVLKGVARARPLRLQNMPKTAKRPERPYGGVLCSKCTRAKIKDLANQQ